MHVPNKVANGECCDQDSDVRTAGEAAHAGGRMTTLHFASALGTLLKSMPLTIMAVRACARQTTSPSVAMDQSGLRVRFA